MEISNKTLREISKEKAVKYVHLEDFCPVYLIPCFFRVSGIINRFNSKRIFRSSHLKEYRMLFASICEHASTATFFASTSSDQICLVSSEHLRKYNWQNHKSLNHKFSANFTRWFIRVRLVP